MKAIAIHTLVKAIKGEYLIPAKGQRACGVSIDSRNIKAQDVFFAIKGDRFDGHDFISSVITQRPAAIIVNTARASQVRTVCSGACRVPLIAVQDTRVALGDYARFYRSQFPIEVVGITGSTGKTTTKEMIAAALSVRFRVLKNQGTYNNDIGVPLTLLRLQDEEVCVAEIGTNHFGEISRLAQILQPTIGVITNIGNSHLESFKNKEGVFQEKKTLFDVKSIKMGITNGEDPYLRTLKGVFLRKGCVWGDFGFASHNLLSVQNISCTQTGITFEINQKYKIRLRTFGVHNVYNALAALTVGYLLGIDIPSMGQRLAQISWDQMRMQRIVRQGKILVNDAYNANPDSVKAAIDVLASHFKNKRTIAVLADMLELGDQSQQLHKQIGEYVTQKGIDQLICVGAAARSIATEAIKHGMDQRSVRHCKDIFSAKKILSQISMEYDVILFKGSRRMHLEDLVNAF